MAASNREDFAELSRFVREGGLLVRRRGYYTIKIGTAVFALGVLAAVAVVVGDSWWNSGRGGRPGVRPHPAGLHRP